MIYIIIILTSICVTLWIYILLLNKEIKSITEQLRAFLSGETGQKASVELFSKKLNQLVIHVNELVENNIQTNIQMHNAQQELRQAIANMSHDLRTPLTSAAGYTDLILNSDLTEDEKISEMKIVEARLKRLTELVDSFFEFSKILTTNKEIELETVNLIGILEECIGNFYEDYKKKNREVDFITSNNKISISTNRTMLSRIFENLISNALNYGSGNLTIEVISENADVIRISFTNRIIDKDLDTGRIFDDFYTTDISRTKGSTGLGLAIAKEFTEQLNGNIEAHIEDDKLVIDTTFVLI